MVEIKHVDVAPLPSSGLLGASQWNTAHSIELSTTARVVGRTTAGGGAAEELSAGTGISFTGGEVVNTAPMVFPASGIAVSTGSDWGTSLAVATDANLRAGLATSIPTSDKFYSANSPVSSSGSGSHAFDFKGGRVFRRTLTGDSTLADPIYQEEGQSGVIYIVQDGTGGHTLDYSSDWKHINAVPEIATDANAVNVFSYLVGAVGEVTLTYLGRHV